MKLATLSLILLCLFAGILYKTKPTTTYANSPRTQQEYMVDLHVTHFTENGTIKDQIYASSWAYMPVNGYSSLVNPKMYLNKLSGAKWMIQAKHGTAWHLTMESKFSKLDLEKTVKIERLATSGFTPIVMQTEQVFYFQDTDFVATIQPVEMDKPGFHLTGVGLNGYLDTGIIQLLNDVKTTYEITS